MFLAKKRFEVKSLDQEITYAGRSRFFNPIKAAIQNMEKLFKNGREISFPLDKEGGYSGNIMVEIRESDHDTFWTDWAGNDPTRFPARIKAAVTVLKQEGFSGRFQIIHEDGKVSIQVV